MEKNLFLNKKSNRNENNKNLQTKKLNSLEDRMKESLLGSKFRILNEKLYTISSEEAFEYFKNNPEDFEIYHQGFEIQASKWPLNPNFLILNELKKNKYNNKVISDHGCGEAFIAQHFAKENIPRKIYSFDLVKINEFITPCDIKSVPLESNSVNISIFCLSLMGINFVDFLIEAKRILKDKGILIVAEIISRITSLDFFISIFKKLGFKLRKNIKIKKYFILLIFRLKKNASNENLKIEEFYNRTDILKPCIYKKR